MKKFKRALSVISATVMSGLCVFSNMTIANAYSNTEYPIGALEDTQSQWNELYSQFDQSFSSIDLNNITSVPTSCDLSTNADKKYLPPIGSQGSIPSCVAWASTYYQFTYAANKLNDITSTSSTAYSPAWTYNLINGGNYNGNDDNNAGTCLTDAYSLLKNQGALKMSEQPYNKNSYDDSWSTDTSAMMNALGTRVSYCGEVTIPSTGKPITSKTDDDLKEAKFLLSTGHILVIGASADDGMANWSFKDCYNVQNRKVAYRASKGDGGHAMAVIGYNDNIMCDVNGNDQIEDTERGAFKIANSWGTGWKNSGYIWVMYDALNKETSIPGDWQTHEPGQRISAFSHSFYQPNRFIYIEVSNYNVNLAGVLTLSTNYRNNFKVDLFRNNTSTTSYTNSISYLNYWNTNSAKSFSGSLVFDYSNYADPVSTATNGYYYGVDVNNLGYNSSGVSTNVSYKIVDNKLNTVKSISNMPTTIAYNQNARRSVKIQCIKGDINYDGVINSLDLSLLSEYTLGNYNFSNLQNHLGDFNEDGEVNNNDVSALSTYLVTHSSRSELSKVSALTQKYTKYMIDNNFDESEIVEMQDITKYIKNRMTVDSMI